MKTRAEIMADIRYSLKVEYPDHKFSVTQDRYSINISLMSAPYSPFSKLVDINGNPHDGTYAQLNHYHIDRDLDGNWSSNGYYLKPFAARMLKRVTEIGNKDNWDHSDSQIDYFDVNYYFDLNIGKWDRPFTVRS